MIAKKKPEERCFCGKEMIPKRYDFVATLSEEHWRHACGPFRGVPPPPPKPSTKRRVL